MTDVNDVIQQIHFPFDIFIQQCSQGWEVASRCLSSIDDDFCRWEIKITNHGSQAIAKTEDGYYLTVEDALIVTSNFLAEQLHDREEEENDDKDGEDD